MVSKTKKAYRNVGRRLDIPPVVSGMTEYVGVPSDYLLLNRLCLDREAVYLIRLAYAGYQDTVREVLEKRRKDLEFRLGEGRKNNR